MTLLPGNYTCDRLGPSPHLTEPPPSWSRTFLDGLVSSSWPWGHILQLHFAILVRGLLFL
jgi:hypothetical protein